MKQDNKIKHLEMIENIIERMAKNRLQLKAWAITIFTLVGALTANNLGIMYMFLILVPILSFWILDGYYLRLERGYKDLYDIVRLKKEDDIDFDLNIRFKSLSKKEKSSAIRECMLTISVVWVYGVLVFELVLLVAIKEGWIPWII